MKKITTTLLIFFVIGYASLFSQSTFTWGGTYGGSGTNRTYTTTVSGITMSATINNNQNVWQASSPSNSPLYCLASGLYLANDWTSTAGNNVVTITFSSPVAAPITFSISDMNSNYCDEVSNSQDCYFWDEVQVTATTPAGLGILPTASSGSGQTNTNSGNNRIIRAKPEANSGTYGCFTNNFTVGASGQCVKTLTISYKNYTGESATIYQADPRFQYIIITQLLSSAPPAAPTNVTFPTSCANSAITLTGTGTNASSNWYTGGCNSLKPILLILLKLLMMALSQLTLQFVLMMVQVVEQSVAGLSLQRKSCKMAIKSFSIQDVLIPWFAGEIACKFV